MILICGLPGSGKTTLSKRLATELGAVRMCPDEWMHALDIDLWDQPARGRVEQLQWAQTTRLLALGVTVIIEWGLWTRGERDALRDQVHALGGADRAALPRRARWTSSGVVSTTATSGRRRRGP